MGEWLGKRIEIEVTNVAHGGVCVGRHEGRVVFVGDTIPGETVSAVVTDDSKRAFWRAETVAVRQPSPHRRPHVWAAASLDRPPELRPGGAEFGHIELAHQRELKRQVLADALQRLAGVRSDVVVEPADGRVDGTGWRTRLRLHVTEDGIPGPYAARSHRVIPVTDLPLATSAALAPLTERFPGARHLDVVAPSVGEARVLVEDGRRRRPITIHERVGEQEFELDARGFWQVHTAAPATLTRAVQAAIDRNRFDPSAANLDLYGGVGLLGAALAASSDTPVRLTSVESDRAASGHAAANLARWHSSVAADRVDRYLRGLVASATATGRSALNAATVLLDPPRSGAGKPVVDQLVRLGPAQLVYVACDPIALARDVGLLLAGGYALHGLRAFDLFPHTHHFEAVATLVKA